MRETFSMYCPNPRCEAGWFEIERVGVGYGALFIEIDDRGIEWRIAANQPICPKCGVVLLGEGESLGAEGYLEMLERNHES